MLPYILPLTVVVAAYSSDGVVLSADSKVAASPSEHSPPRTKRQQPQRSNIRQLGPRLAVAFSGYPVARVAGSNDQPSYDIDDVADAVRERLNGKESPQRAADELRDVLRRTLGALPDVGRIDHIDELCVVVVGFQANVPVIWNVSAKLGTRPLEIRIADVTSNGQVFVCGLGNREAQALAEVRRRLPQLVRDSPPFTLEELGLISGTLIKVASEGRNDVAEPIRQLRLYRHKPAASSTWSQTPTPSSPRLR